MLAELEGGVWENASFIPSVIYCLWLTKRPAGHLSLHCTDEGLHGLQLILALTSKATTFRSVYVWLYAIQGACSVN